MRTEPSIARTCPSKVRACSGRPTAGSHSSTTRPPRWHRTRRRSASPTSTAGRQGSPFLRPCPVRSIATADASLAAGSTAISRLSYAFTAARPCSELARSESREETGETAQRARSSEQHHSGETCVPDHSRKSAPAHDRWDEQRGHDEDREEWIQTSSATQEEHENEHRRDQR